MKFLQQTKNEILHKELIVTTSWDDGSVSDIKLSKLLEKYSLKATFYITKDYEYMEKNLTVKQIINLGQKYEIGAHTLTHPDLDKIGIKKAMDEIKGSKEYLESILDYSIEMFCYPRGRYNPKIIDVVQQAGFVGARTCKLGNFIIPTNVYTVPITLQVSNGSPVQIVRLCISNNLSVKSVIDWENRAKELFDIFLKKGGVYHLWGHSSEIAANDEWDKLERVFKYISNRSNVRYLSNGEIVKNIIN